MHIITLSIDDGFKKSCTQIAEIYERYDLSACFNVIATGHLDSFVAPDEEQDGVPKGDFELWNALQDRGHEIMPHSYRHANLRELPFEESKQLILDCLDVFDQELAGFDRKQSIYNFSYNASTPELEAWLPSVVKAFRTKGPAFNPLPYPGMSNLSSISFGPGNSEAHLDARIEELLTMDSGWLIHHNHGLDGEGWGPIGSDYLDKLLARLTAIDSVKVLPTAEVLKLAEI